MWRKIIAFLFDSIYQVVTWVWIGISISAFFFFASNKSKGGMILSAIGLLAAILVMLSLMAKKHFWDGEAGKKRKRPELYSNAAMMGPLVPGEPETVLVGLRNRGDESARNICLGGGNHVFTKSDFTGPLVYKHVPVQVRPDIGPGEENSAISKSPQPLTARQIEQLKNGEVLFFHFAEGEYNDDAGNTYPIDYCYMFNPLSPTVMSICPEKYWPKSRTDRRGAPTLDAVPKASVNKSAPPLRWTDYTEDYFGGLIWRWEYRPEMGDQIPRNIRCICPEDGLVLRGYKGVAISEAAGRSITFTCLDHPHNAAEVSCGISDDYEGIRVFIQARLKDGTWRDIVKQQREARGGEK